MKALRLYASENPFRAQRFHALAYRAADAEPGALLARLHALGGRGVIAGPHGHGKTTLLNALHDHLAGQGAHCVRIALNSERNRMPVGCLDGAPTDSYVLLDGAEQMSALAWRRFLMRSRHAKGVVITTHAPGRLPLLYACRTDEQLLNELLLELAPGADAALRAHARHLFAAHRGNLREVWFGLYTHCASINVV